VSSLDVTRYFVFTRCDSNIQNYEHTRLPDWHL